MKRCIKKYWLSPHELVKGNARKVSEKKSRKVFAIGLIHENERLDELVNNINEQKFGKSTCVICIFVQTEADYI